ncbi:MAG: response regulator transcription factor [Chloroflexota bacterium]|nr:response regulator transcription factor [Chloroflexota bacterium]
MTEARETTRIAIVDDHELLREGVAYTLGAVPDFEIVGQGASADDAIRLCEDLLPDLLLLDINLPGGGLNAAQAIAASCPVTKVVMLTVSEQEDDVLAALKAGARAYVLKGVPARELISVLRSVHQGEVWVSPTLAASLLRELSGTTVESSGQQPQVRGPLSELTAREHEILELVASGASNKEIGQQLHLTEKTVKHYMTNILQKLQVRNRVEAAMLLQKAERGRS